jgi:hypothetical protein
MGIREHFKTKFVTGYKITHEDYVLWLDECWFKTDTPNVPYADVAGVANSVDYLDVTNFPVDLLTNGDGTKYLADDGTYKTVISGGATESYTNATPSVITVGGIAAGSTFNNKSMTQMFDALLYPELFPTLTNPTSTFVLTQAGLQEIGAVLTLNFSSSFNRGSISPAYGTSGFRSGLPNTYVYTGSGLTSASTINLSNSNVVNSYTVLAGAQNWSGRVSYDAGGQPLSSKGNNYNTTLPAGVTSTTNQTITGVYPFYGTTVDIAVDTKQPLALHNASYYSVSMVAESGGAKQTAKFPSVFSPIVGIKFYNTVSSAWEWIGGSKANSLTVFTTSNITINGVAYIQYRHNSASIGARQLQFYTV